jgi:RNA polymerase sigma factor (sigma-70 family)
VPNFDFEWALHYAYRVARARKLGREDAREIASLVVEDLVKRYEPDKITLALIGIRTRDRVRNWYRDNAARIAFETDTVPLDEARDAAVDMTTGVETRADLERALGALDSEVRDLVVAHAIEGKTTRELAKERGVSHTTIENRVRAGLEVLRGSPVLSSYS